MQTEKRPIRKIACIGEVMIELIAGDGDSATIGVAGDTFNSAYYLQQALKNQGISVSYVTALGDDTFSDRICKTVSDAGIEVDHIERRAGMMPGLYAIETDDHGERSFSYWRSASAARTLFQAPCEITLGRLNDFDMVMLSGITMAILPPETRANVMAWADDFRANGGTLVYDSNHRPRLWESPETAREVNALMWSRADIALPSVDDEMALYGDTSEAEVVSRLHGYGVTCGALKRGAEGPLDLATDTVLTDAKAAEKVVDSTAAGDSFNAGYLAGFAMGRSQEAALRTGHNLAAHIVTQPGAIVPLPDDLLA